MLYAGDRDTQGKEAHQGKNHHHKELRGRAENSKDNGSYPQIEVSRYEAKYLRVLRILWTLFGDGCNYYVEVLEVLWILESKDVYAMRKAYTPEVCRRIIWAILHDGRRFFDKKKYGVHLETRGQISYLSTQHSQQGP
jgi:hypothetical protein